MSRLIRSEFYPGDIGHFRTQLMSLVNRLWVDKEGWRPSVGGRIVFGEYLYMAPKYYVPANGNDRYGAGTITTFDWRPDCDEIASSIKRPKERASWQVVKWHRPNMRPMYSNEGVYSAGIEAYEQTNNTTLVEFLDGYDPEEPLRQHPEIGPAFQEFTDWVIGEVWPAQGIGKGEETELLPEQDPLAAARSEVKRFKSYVERQAYRDIYTDGKPQENIARALLQAFLPERSYREVQVRGGQSDLLLFVKQGRFLYETKIWRGPKYYKQGLKEIEEYIIGEDDDQELLGIFYVVFDHTKTKRARAYQGDDFSTEVVGGRNVDVVVVDLSPPEPSKKD